MPLNFVIMLCVTFFVLGVAGLYITVSAIGAAKRRGQRTKRSKPNDQKAEPKKKTVLDRMGTMNLILFIVGIVIFWFTVTMIDLFKTCGSVPDTLVNCVFLMCGGECGVMGWIKTSKEKYRDRMWDKEDARAMPRPPAAGLDDDDPGGVG